MASIYEEIKSFKEEQIGWRRELHRIPELGVKLPETIAYITARLDEIGVDYQVFEDVSCVLVTIGSGERCILLRGDVDGLPGQELNDLDFKASNGCMHTCGHDMHAANMLGVCKYLKAHEAELNGTVKLLFQSGEETFQGAKAAIERGVLENPKVDAAFGMHVFAVYGPDEIRYDIKPMASVWGFEITIKGKGGHGSQPENCIDPIYAGVKIYEEVTSIIPKELKPGTEAVLTIGQFTAGSAANSIPDQALLRGTLRTFEKEDRAYIIKRVHEVVQALASALRVSAEVKTISDCPGVYCDPELSLEFVESAKKALPDMKVIKGVHLMGSEDFAFIGEEVPSSYFIIGAGVEDLSKRYGQHNAKIMFDEDAMAKASAVYAQIAMDFLNK